VVLKKKATTFQRNWPILWVIVRYLSKFLIMTRLVYSASWNIIALYRLSVE
jgi:hypothetical protein